MRAIFGALLLLVVLAVVGLLAWRQTQSLAPAVSPASGGLPSGPAERARTAEQRAAESVARAMEGASAARDAAENR